MRMRNVLALWYMLLYSAAPSGIRPSTIVAHLMLNGHEQNQATFEWQLDTGSAQLLSQARTALQSPVIRIFVGHGNEVHDATMYTHRCRFTPDTSQVALRDVRADELLRAIATTQRTIHLYFTAGAMCLQDAQCLIEVPTGEALAPPDPQASSQADQLLATAELLNSIGDNQRDGNSRWC